MDSLKCLNLIFFLIFFKHIPVQGVLTLLHKGGEQEDIKKTGDHWY
jgi:hypothetical protein